MEAEQFKTLLDQVNTLNSHYKKINQITGENFNIFRILNLESSEVRLHSAFLAELLNPKGNHGQKDTFLKLFIKAFCFKGNSIDSESCTVEIEKHIISINETFTEGGRIDIVVKDKNEHKVVIENKIYAGDQKNQMLRYYNYDTKADLIYLTLDGKEPDKSSIGNLVSDTHFKTYSYKSDILNWLDQCRKEVAVFPIVREGITQYINLIKYLTNQTSNKTMQEELGNLMVANLEASFSIVENIDSVLEKVLAGFAIKLERELQELKLDFSVGINLENNYSGISIWNSTWNHVKINFEFQSYDKELIYGFTIKKGSEKLSSEFSTKFKTLLGTSKSNNVWPWYKRLEDPYNNWSKYEAWKAIVDGTMQKHIKAKVEFLLKATEGMEL